MCEFGICIFHPDLKWSKQNATFELRQSAAVVLYSVELQPGQKCARAIPVLGCSTGIGERVSAGLT